MREELKDKIIIRAELDPSYRNGNLVTNHCYYVLDVNSCEVSSTSITPTQTPNSINGSTLVVGCKLFILGDPSVEEIIDDNNEDECFTYYFDLTQPNQGWKRVASPLILGNFHPVCVEFGGKIYIFRDSGFDCRSEVFDLQTNQWCRINNPPRHRKRTLEITLPVMADHKGNRIMIYFENVSELYAYYPNEDRWVLVKKKFEGWIQYLDQVALVDGVIYIFNQYCNYLRAFVIDTKQWLKITFPVDTESHLRLRSGYDYECLLYRGNGVLCVVGGVCRPREWPVTATTASDFIVRAVDFKVSNVNDADKDACVTWLSSREFFIPERCTYLDHLIV